MANRIRILLPLILSAVMVLTAFVCTGSQQRQAAKLADTYAQTLKSIHDSVDTALVTGKLSAQERQTVYQALLRANEAGLHLNAAIRGVANSQTRTTAVLAAITEAQQAVDDGTAAIKDPATKAQIQTLASTVKAVLSELSTLYSTSGGSQ